MMSLRQSVLPVLMSVGLCLGTAQATDYLLDGTKLVLKNVNGKKKLVWVSKDDAVAPPADDPDTVVPPPEVLVCKYENGSPHNHAVAKAILDNGWSTNASGTVDRYRNAQAPAGDSVCKVALVKPGKRVKVVCKDTIVQLFTPVVVGQITLRIGQDRYCAEFGGAAVIRDEPGLFVARGGAAPSACMSPSGAFLGAVEPF